MPKQHVPGKKLAPVMLYALSTCIWCKKTKKLLDDLGVEYDYLYVDLESGEAKQEAIATVTKWNPQCSFPTMVIANKCIIGFREDEIREALKQSPAKS